MTESAAAVLVVDDDPLNRILLCTSLEEMGYDTDQAEDGRQALERARVQTPDLMLLDIVMPVMDGFAVLRALREDDDLRNLPVIVISAQDDMESVVRSIELGAEDHLPKPVEPLLLRARVQSSLERKRLRDRESELFHQLEENYQRLQESERQRAELTDMIVHDLRTPLTAFTSGVRTAIGAGELSELQREMLEIAIAGGDTLLGMINDLLDISKMEDGSMPIESAPVNARAVLDGAVRQVASLAADNDLSLATDDIDADLTVVADHEKLSRTLTNLLGNAIKFTPPGGEVTAGAVATDGGCVRFFVRDTGEGIPADALDRIFEKFGQVETRRAGRKMSSGLGLTFCKMVVEAHGGCIWAESELGQGSTFLFELPADGPGTGGC